MPQIHIRAELTPGEFPYNFSELGSTIIVDEGTDIPKRTPSGFSGPEASKNYGVCQPYLLENVLPISRGYSSIGFTEKIPPNEDVGDIISAFTVFGGNGAIAFLLADRERAYIYDPNGASWETLEFPAAVRDTITHGTVRDTTFIHFGTGIYTYDFVSKSFTQETLLGIAGVGGTYGLCAAGSQLVLWEEDRIYLSSVIDPRDFTPSLSTGAASVAINALKGTIVGCVALDQSFIIYSNVNAIAAKFTGNLTAPHRYVEIPGSSGIFKLDHVAFNANTGGHVVWTQQGLQLVQLEGAEYYWPELSDGVIRGFHMERHPFFGMPEIKQCSGFDVKVSYASNRYLVVSLRQLESESTDYEIGYLYDSVLQRWGVLKVPHKAFLEYIVPESYNVYTYDDLNAEYANYGELAASNKTYRTLSPATALELPDPGTTLGMVTPDGSLQSINWHETAESRGTNGSELGAVPACVILGKYKAVRNAGFELQHIKVDRLHDASIVCYGHEYTGDICKIREDFIENTRQPGQFFGRLPSDSFSLQFTGVFTLTDLQITANTLGGVNQHSLFIQKLITMTTPPLLDLFKTSKPYPALDFGVLEAAGTEINPLSFMIIDAGLTSVTYSLRNVIELWEPLVQFNLLPEDFLASSYELRDTIELYSILIQHEQDDPEMAEVTYSLLDALEIDVILIVHTQYDIDGADITYSLRDVIAFD